MRITYPYPRHLSACVLADLSPWAEPRFAPVPPPRAVAFPVLRRLKARAMHKHTEVLGMFWDRVAPLYDFFGNAFNRAGSDGTGEAVARDDCVHEGACGTGAISAAIVPVCARLGLARRAIANARENKLRV